MEISCNSETINMHLVYILIAVYLTNKTSCKPFY